MTERNQQSQLNQTRPVQTNVEQSTNAYEDQEEHEDQERPQHDIAIPAIRHIGPTLELAQTKEDQDLADAEDMLRDAENRTSIYEPGPDAPRVKDPNEPLRTRLPGDTSSEPHTDVGPDNAATVQHRGE
jgi:hypothetical protein